jgi:hypothetical protein
MRAVVDCASTFITLGTDVAANGVIGTIDLGAPENRIYGSIDLICFAVVATGVTTGADLVYEKLVPGLTSAGEWVYAGTDTFDANVAFLASGSASHKSVVSEELGLGARKFRVTLANRTDGTFSVYWMPQEQLDYKRAGF